MNIAKQPRDIGIRGPTRGIRLQQNAYGTNWHERALAFISPDKRKTFAPHAHDVIYVGRAPSHYRLLQFWNPRTQACSVTGTYKLHPTHCRMPTISEGDQTIIAATELVRAYTNNIPKVCQMKENHARIMAKLTEIMKCGQTPRVGTTQAAPTPRVHGDMTTTSNATDPEVLRTQKRIHPKQTRANTPHGTNTSKLRTVNGITIGYKKNSAKGASRKRIQRLIEEQTKLDRATLTNAENQITVTPGNTFGIT